MTPQYYWEDFTQGEKTELGYKLFEKDTIKSFAQKYDPQLFHTDEEKVAQSIF